MLTSVRKCVLCASQTGPEVRAGGTHRPAQHPDFAFSQFPSFRLLSMALVLNSQLVAISVCATCIRDPVNHCELTT